MLNDSHDTQLTIAQLAELAGVSRRTVHFYVQQGLVDAPEERGRGSFYTGRHLEQIKRVLSLQREGLPLRQIQGLPEALAIERAAAAPHRELVLRLAVAPGITLELAAGPDGAVPTTEQLNQLARCCAEILARN